jgi:3-oxoacyl-[acyl-carrier protein] reductase
MVSPAHIEVRDLLDLTERVAAVTGAGSGMGQGISIRLAEAGAHVLCLDLNGEAAAATVGLITEAGGSAEAATLDVGNKADFTAVMADYVDRRGRLDVMCNIAGVTSLLALVLDVPADELEQAFRVHFKGVLFGCQAALPTMTAQRSGSIINMSSTTIDICRRLTVDYGVGKVAVAALTRVLAQEVGPHNVRVNAIAPGFVATPGFLDRHPVGPKRDAHFQSWFDMSPMARISSIEEIGNQVLYLASPASSFVTGQILRANGGVSMPW